MPSGTPVVNALFRQKACIENIFRACIGLAPVNHMMMEYKHEKLAASSRRQDNVAMLKHKHPATPAVANGNQNGVSNGHACVVNGSDSEGEK